MEALDLKATHELRDAFLALITLVVLSACLGTGLDVDGGSPPTGDLVGRVLGETPTPQGLTIEPAVGATVSFSRNSILRDCGQVSGPCTKSEASGLFSLHNVGEGSYTLYVAWKTSTCSMGVIILEDRITDVGDLTLLWGGNINFTSSCK